MLFLLLSVGTAFDGREGEIFSFRVYFEALTMIHKEKCSRDKEGMRADASIHRGALRKFAVVTVGDVQVN